VSTGDLITTEPGFLKGHGTIVTSEIKSKDNKCEDTASSGREEKLVATVSGFVERVNKLISVRALNARYVPEVGDVVVGRIIEVADKRWRVDVNSRQNAVLMISAVDLPGGIQRRRTAQDSLEMRNYFIENDLISAEVQKVMSDGAVSLHTRNTKYGKLLNGQFLRVPANLIKRSKNHFHMLPFGVHIIIGVNGYIWLTEAPPEIEEVNESDIITKPLSRSSSLPSASNPSSSILSELEKKKDTSGNMPVIGAEAREKIARVRNSIIALSTMNIAIYRNTIIAVYEESITLGLLAKDIPHPDNLTRVTYSALQTSNIRTS